VFRRRERGIGPNTRTALTYVLATSEVEFDVYATHADAVLAPLDGRRVVAFGKLVSLRDDGYGDELWLASIEPVPDE
jgi:hypothetical protein